MKDDRMIQKANESISEKAIKFMELLGRMTSAGLRRVWTTGNTSVMRELTKLKIVKFSHKKGNTVIFTFTDDVGKYLYSDLFGKHLVSGEWVRHNGQHLIGFEYIYWF